MNNQLIAKIFNTAHGIGTHEPMIGTIHSLDQGEERRASCKHCRAEIRSYWLDDEDRNGWSEWRSNKSCVMK